MEDTNILVSTLQKNAYRLKDSMSLDPLMDRIGFARYALLAEASHGTSEYYRWRTEISKRLILEKGFSFLAVEGDWPDCYVINQYIKGKVAAKSVDDLLRKSFKRWPAWMWANEEIAELVGWLKEYNDTQPEEKKVGFYGLDVYSLWQSLYAVTSYLQQTGSPAFPAAYRALQCFEPFGEDAHEYAQSTFFIPDDCREEVVTLLKKIVTSPKTGDKTHDRESLFNAEQNAFIVKNAEHYYRMMIRTDEKSWNIRDQHMAQTLIRLMQFHGVESKGIVWAHNTHIGDARYTDMKDDGMVNLGQLIREQEGEKSTILVGFGSYAGTVIASSAWDGPIYTMPVPQAREDSWEDIFHKVGNKAQLLISRDVEDTDAFSITRGHRAIGVIYRPQSEYGNYVPTILPKRYDAFLYIDQTHALHPLAVGRPPEKDFPETYPFAQ